MEEVTTRLVHDGLEAKSCRSSRSSSTESTRTIQGHMMQEGPGNTSSRRGRWRIYLAVTAIFLFVGGSIFMFKSTHTKSSSVTWRHCGSSPVEARANDCVYDFIAGAFVPRACFDAELEDEFMKLRDWRFYADHNAEQELSVASIRMDGGTEPMFVSVEYHWIHCTYTWMKLHRSRMLGTPIDDHIASYEHTTHCGRGLLSQCDANDTRPIIAFLHHYTTCIA